MDLQVFVYSHNQHSEGGRKEHIVDYDTGEVLCGKNSLGGTCVFTSFDYDYITQNGANVLYKHFCQKCLFKALELIGKEL